jgi:hypothetical protein
MKEKISEEEFAALVKIEGRYLEVFQEERKRLISAGKDIKTEPTWLCDFGWTAWITNGPTVFKSSKFMKTRKGAVSNLYRKYYANSR